MHNILKKHKNIALKNYNWFEWNFTNITTIMKKTMTLCLLEAAAQQYEFYGRAKGLGERLLKKK